MSKIIITFSFYLSLQVPTLMIVRLILKTLQQTLTKGHPVNHFRSKYNDIVLVCISLYILQYNPVYCGAVQESAISILQDFTRDQEADHFARDILFELRQGWDAQYNVPSTEKESFVIFVAATIVYTGLTHIICLMGRVTTFRLEMAQYAQELLNDSEITGHVDAIMRAILAARDIS